MPAAEDEADANACEHTGQRSRGMHSLSNDSGARRGIREITAASHVEYGTRHAPWFQCMKYPGTSAMQLQSVNVYMSG